MGRTGTPENLDQAMFYRALGSFPNLKGENFVPVQDAIDRVTTVKSNIQPLRGAFLRVKDNDLEIIEPNAPK